MKYLIDVDAALLLGSILLFILSVLNGRRQILGVLLAMLALLAYAVYYADQLPLTTLAWRDLIGFVRPLGGDQDFTSSVVPAYLILVLYVIRIVVYWRTPRRLSRIEKLTDRTAIVGAGVASAIMVGSLADSAYRWGWLGAVLITVGFLVAYFLAAVVFGQLIAIVVAAWRVAFTALRRWVRLIGADLVRFVRWFASWAGRFRSNLGGVIQRLTDVQGKLDQQIIDDQRIFEEKLLEQAENERLRAQRD